MDVYKQWVRENSKSPDPRAPRVRAMKDAGRKYMALVALGDKVAAGYLDSGSHYTVISYDMACKYGMQHLIKPSRHCYLVASGNSYSFTGEIPGMSMLVGEV